MQTRKWRIRAFGWGCVLGWHALLGWVLWHAVGPPGQDDGAPALALVYLGLPAQEPPRDRAPAAKAKVVRAAGRRRQPPAATREATAAPTPAPALSVVVMKQARAYAAASAETPLAPRDPFERPRALPPAASGRFAMHRAITPADVAAVIGTLVGGPDYDPDPCPRNRRNLQNLLAAGDSQRLQLALRFDQAHCRP